MRNGLFLGCLAVVCGLATPAHAGVLYQFADSAGTPTTNFTISGVGNTVDVRVYLQEDPSPGILASEGLFSASLNVLFDSPAGIAEVTAAGDVTPNPFFTNIVSGPSVASATAGFTGDVGLNPFLFPDGSGRILLGTFRFTGLAVGTTTIRAVDRDLFLDDTVTGLGTVLDSLVENSAGTITVEAITAVPEPGALALLASGTILIGGCRLVRRRWIRALPRA